MTALQLTVFPMHVGVFPQPESGQVYKVSLPHARGGVSACVVLAEKVNVSSPCTWGCFL